MPEKTKQGIGGDGEAAVDLSEVPIEALVRELKARSHTLVCGLLVEDEDGDDVIKCVWVGSRVAARGMLLEMDEVICHGTDE